MVTCLYCKRKINSVKRLIYHVKKEHYKTSKQYYDEFLKQEDEGFCKICGKKTSYKYFSEGYRRFCSRECVKKSIYNENIIQDPKVVLLKNDNDNKQYNNLNVKRSNRLLKLLNLLESGVKGNNKLTTIVKKCKKIARNIKQ